jgi:predicted Zn-dependent protease with MMP-like domain
MDDRARRDTLPWRDHKAPTLAEFEALATEEFQRLPGEFRRMCGDLVIRVEDFATDEVLDRMGIQDPFELTGLFEGVGLPFQSTSDSGRMPNMVWLYRRPILDEWAERDETLGAMVMHVLVHEIGHHFGLSDADIAAIEASADS